MLYYLMVINLDLSIDCISSPLVKKRESFFKTSLFEAPLHIYPYPIVSGIMTPFTLYYMA